MRKIPDHWMEQKIITQEEQKTTRKDHIEQMRERSGTISINSKLVSFLYELMRDHVPPGVLERIVQDSQDPECLYTNGWLALYAQDLPDRLSNNH